MTEVGMAQLAPPHNLTSSQPTSGGLLPAQGGCGSAVRNRLVLPSTAVNQNGSFEVDRVVKAGRLQKRTQRTKTWKSVFVVLRPTALYIYRSEKEDKLRHMIYLSELGAVAHLRDPKQKRENLFGLFTSSGNYHFQASTHDDAEEWIQLIRYGARLDEEEEEMLLASPTAPRRQSLAGVETMSSGTRPSTALDRGSGGGGWGAGRPASESVAVGQSRLISSSPEPLRPSVQHAPPGPSGPPDSLGNDMASHSDFSDGGDLQQRMRGMSIEGLAATTNTATAHLLAGGEPGPGPQPGSQSGGGGGGCMNIETDPDRVIFQGWLQYLRSKGGMRQWKTTWAVLRPRNLILYKDVSEYTARLIIPLAALVDVVDTDPLGKHREHCFQVITDEKTHKFSAPDEETLLQCIGAYKSLLAKRRELEARLAAATAARAAAAS